MQALAATVARRSESEAIDMSLETDPPVHPLDGDPSPAAAVESPPPPDNSPPLSIMHLLIWTALSAAMMGYSNLVTSLQGQQPRGFSEWLDSPALLTIRTAGAVGNATTLGGLLLLISRRRRGIRFPVQPGEWILVMRGISSVIELGSGLLATIGAQYESRGFWIAYGIIVVLAQLVVYLVPAILCKDNRSWRRFFWTASAISLLAVLSAFSSAVLPRMFFHSNTFMRIYWLLLAVGALMFLIAVGGDLRRSTKRGWVHWVGVVTLAILFLIHQGYYIYLRYFPPPFL